jgi:hypothetical protein
MTSTRTKIRRFWIYRCCPRHWIVEVLRGYTGNYEYSYAHFLTWSEAFNWAWSIAKTWRYPEGWMA